MSKPLTDRITPPSTWLSNFVHQANRTFDTMTAKDYIRLVIIVGVYVLFIRKFLDYLARKYLAQSHKSTEDAHSLTPDGKPKISANDLRDAKGRKVEVDLESSDEEGDEEVRVAKGAEWGRNARKRQKRVVKEALRVREERIKEKIGDDEDADIAEFLVD
ncbi:hypothetical protein M501DRAFT_991576 [Patellaria atrata CBS 101060]|uniref:DUF1531-domain-containing protein n=1 Tax=Patellaria atrata CBS 101060 TaxID=1346257 RepID=A0A9P4VNB4_9PEZI|nr:hypothetical protein M501DRAFT_991576 [Patellaria atrata CBS 101060]